MAEIETPGSDSPQTAAPAGTVIAPSNNAQQPAPTASVPQPGAPTPPASNQAAVSPQPQPATTNQPTPPATPFQFRDDDQFDDEQTSLQDQEPITWTASEFVAHHKSPGWYGLLMCAAAVVALVIYFFTRDFISVAVVVVGAIALGVYAARQPNQLQYQLDNHGLSIGQKHYDYDDFRYFSVVPEGAFSSIVFMPLKRFMPLTTIYYSPQDEQRIIELLSLVMPMEDHKHDPVERFMQRIRF